MVQVIDIITRIGLDGAVIGTLSRQIEWELEELSGSTNRLKVEIPLEDGFEVTPDEELLFRRRRYVITEITRHKNSRITEITADEAQTELSDRYVRSLALDKDSLEDATAKVLQGTEWKAGETFFTDIELNAELANQSVAYCLTFLESQTGGRLVFDSINKIVTMEDRALGEPKATFHYKRNMDDISKTEIQPKATVLFPYGREGMTIESLNDGETYIEDFSWYTGLGMKLSDARTRFRKELVWEDDRYVYVGNLLREAKKKLATLSQPQINYSLKTSNAVANGLHINDMVYVVDDELGIKIKTVISRVITSSDPSNNSIELEYVPNSLSDIVSGNTAGDSSGSGSSEAVFISKNRDKVTLTGVPAPVLTTSITVIASTFFHVSLVINLNVVTTGTIRGHFTMDGNEIPTKIRQTAQEGWHTIGLPFIMDNVMEGTKNLDFHMYVEGGSGEIAPEGIELYITSKGALGGAKNERPDRRVIEEIEIPHVPAPNVIDLVNVHQERPVNPNIKEHIRLPETSLGVADVISLELNGPITDPNSIPDGEFEETDWTGFANMAEYEEYKTPTQEQVSSFIEEKTAVGSSFKVITANDGLYVIHVPAGSISVNYFTRRVSSGQPMTILTPSGELMTEVLELDWTEIVGDIREHELVLLGFSEVYPDENPYAVLWQNIPVPQSRTYDNLIIRETFDGIFELYYSNGDTIMDYSTSYPNETRVGTASYSEWYVWNKETLEWNYESSTSSTVKRIANSFLTILNTNTIYHKDTSTVYQEPTVPDDIGWKHINEIPEFPTEWQGLPYQITKWSSGDRIRLIVYRGDIVLGLDGYGFSSTEAGWYSYKWDGVKWLYRSTATGKHYGALPIIQYTSHDIKDTDGNVVIPAGTIDTSGILNG